MKEIVDRLQETRQIELAKSILESKGYKVSRQDENETISTEEKNKILAMFKSTSNDVLSTEEQYEDGMHLFRVSTDNSNPTYIGWLTDKLRTLEDTYNIGYDAEQNDSGFYGQDYIFYKYDE